MEKEFAPFFVSSLEFADYTLENALELNGVFDELKFISPARSDSKRQCSGYLAPWAVENHSS
jgi:hypothetical protein